MGLWNSMINGLGSWKHNSLADVMTGNHIHTNPAGHPPTWECKGEAEKTSRQSRAIRIAADTIQIAAGHEMARANSLVRKIYEAAIGADGLISMVFNDGWFAQEEAQHKRQERQTSEMHNIGGVYQAYQLKQVGQTDNSERQR